MNKIFPGLTFGIQPERKSLMKMGVIQLPAGIKDQGEVRNGEGDERRGVI